MIIDNAEELRKKRYYKDGEETKSDLLKRVAHSIATAKGEDNPQQSEEIFYNMMASNRFLPSSPCLMNSNTEHTGQLSSCFIIEVTDNLESIYQAKADCAAIFQANGGVGFNLSALRPRDADVIAHGGKSCGIVSFLEEFDLTADIITRNNVRKGAIKVDVGAFHPDILEFISCKDNTSKLTHMNISVGITDSFMKAVKGDWMWDLRFPDYKQCKNIYEKLWDGDIEAWERRKLPVKTYRTVKARALYREIMEHAWKTGEPGVSMLDAMERGNMNKHAGKVMGTNPCAEFCNVPWASCNLGSINLSEMVVNKEIDPVNLRITVSDAVHFLDNMVSVNNLPVDKIQETTEYLRPIGLGVMGVADAMYKMGISYGSTDATQFIQETMSKIRLYAIDASESLAEKRGNYDGFKGSEWEKTTDSMRNGNLLSIAPTGSISMLANTSGGIEPNFALVYNRRTNDGDEYYMVNPVFEKYLRDSGLYTKEILDKIQKNNGSCQGVEEIPHHIQKIFVVASDLTVDQHLFTVGEAQKYVDLSISKTVNLPEYATVEEVEGVYMKAWELGVKGITIYRDGSRENQTLSARKTGADSYAKPLDKKFDKTVPVTREQLGGRLESATYVKSVACGKVYIIISHDKNGDLVEVFVDGAKSGGCTTNTEAIGRLASMALRSGVSVNSVVDSIKGLKCAACQQIKGSKAKHIDGLSCSDVIAKTISNEFRLQKVTMSLPSSSKASNTTTHQGVGDVLAKDENNAQSNEGMAVCPDCGKKQLIHTGGCVQCSCGWTKCG